MKVQLVLENADEARTALNLLQEEGVEKNAIEVSSPSIEQVKRIESSQYNEKFGPIKPSMVWSILVPAAFLSLITLIALNFISADTTLSVKILAVFLSVIVGAFLGLVVSKFRFSSLRRYNSVKIPEGSLRGSMDKICLQFSADKTKKKKIQEKLERVGPVELKFFI